MMNGKDEPIQPWSGKAGEPFRLFRNRLRLHLGTKTDKSSSSVTNYLDGDDMSGPHPPERSASSCRQRSRRTD
jgi:hypothetical protein